MMMMSMDVTSRERRNRSMNGHDKGLDRQSPLMWSFPFHWNSCARLLLFHQFAIFFSLLLMCPGSSSVVSFHLSRQFSSPVEMAIINPQTLVDSNHPDSACLVSSNNCIRLSLSSLSAPLERKRVGWKVCVNAILTTRQRETKNGSPCQPVCLL